MEARKPSSEECRKLAEIAKSASKGTPLESSKSIEEVAKSIESLSANEGFQFWIAFDKKGNIVGWTYDYFAFPLMTFISGFLPHVVDTQDSEEIVFSLIKAEKRSTVERGHSRLEIELVFPSDEHRKHSERFINWYKKCGFQYAAEEVHMTSNLDSIDLPKLDTPQGHTLKRFSDVTYNQLEEPGFQTFKNSGDGLFTSMTHTEQKVTLEHFFSHSTPFIEEASFILEKETKIVGFIVTRKRHDEIEIGPVGLIPEARGKGLANYLLVRSLEGLKDAGINKVSLDMSVTNDPAMKLYRRFGFVEAYHKQFYYWSP